MLLLLSALLLYSEGGGGTCTAPSAALDALQAQFGGGAVLARVTHPQDGAVLTCAGGGDGLGAELSNSVHAGVRLEVATDALLAQLSEAAHAARCASLEVCFSCCGGQALGCRPLRLFLATKQFVRLSGVPGGRHELTATLRATMPAAAPAVARALAAHSVQFEMRCAKSSGALRPAPPPPGGGRGGDDDAITGGGEHFPGTAELAKHLQLGPCLPPGGGGSGGGGAAARCCDDEHADAVFSMAMRPCGAANGGRGGGAHEARQGGGPHEDHAHAAAREARLARPALAALAAGPLVGPAGGDATAGTAAAATAACAEFALCQVPHGGSEAGKAGRRPTPTLYYDDGDPAFFATGPGATQGGAIFLKASSRRGSFRDGIDVSVKLLAEEEQQEEQEGKEDEGEGEATGGSGSASRGYRSVQEWALAKGLGHVLPPQPGGGGAAGSAGDDNDEDESAALAAVEAAIDALEASGASADGWGRGGEIRGGGNSSGAAEGTLLLAGFKGQRYRHVHDAWVRAALRSLDNVAGTAAATPPPPRHGEGVAILTKCHGFEQETFFPAASFGAECAAEQRRYDGDARWGGAAGYWRLLRSAWFGFAPRGVGLHSMRLLEMLRFGTVPVLLADGYLPPLGGTAGDGGLLRWEEFSLAVPEAEARDASLQLLRAVPLARRLRMSLRAWQAYRCFFASPYRTLAAALHVVGKRLRQGALVQAHGQGAGTCAACSERERRGALETRRSGRFPFCPDLVAWYGDQASTWPMWW